MTREDIPDIGEWMLRDALWQRYRLTAEGIDADFREALDRDDLLLVADAELPARGFSWCLLNGMFGTQAYLKRIGIDPAFTGQNIGALLLARTEELAQATNRTVLFLLVSDFNVPAQRFYRRSGYQQIGTFPRLVLPDATELLFSKEIRSLA